MTLKTIGILLAVSAAIFSKHSESRVFPDDSGLLLFNAPRKNENSGEKKEHNVCQTDACKILGRELKSSMNTSVDPCENFYDFVCGAWNDRIDLIPSYERSWGRRRLFQHTVYERIKSILEVDPEPSDILPVRQAKKWYRTCMDKEEREKRGIKPIESILMQTGGWPMVMDPEEWSEDGFSWQDLEINYFYITGELIFYQIIPEPGNDGEDSDGAILITASQMPPDEDLASRLETEEEVKWNTHTSILKRVAKVFIKHSKADVSDEMIEKDVEDLVNFEKELDSVYEMDIDYLETTVGEFLKQYDADVTGISRRYKIDFEQVLKMLFGMINAEVTDNQKISVMNAGFFTRLTKLLSETPQRTIANYIHWYFVRKVMQYTTEEIQTIVNEELAKDTGVKNKQPRWLECVKNLPLDQATSYAFATKYFTKRTEKNALEIIENIRQQLELQIQDSNWLNKEGKDALVDKLNSIKLFVGFPDWYRNESVVKSSYKGLKVGYNYFENILNFRKFQIRQELKAIQEKTEYRPWDMGPTEVNAIYGPDANFITFPAANFQPPLFTPHLPANVNYGMVGSIVGHEMGHAYDDTGIKRNKQGDKTELSNQMIENYYKRAECFLDQYNNYWSITEPVYEGTTPGYGEGSMARRTWSENIADTTGLNSAFKAWQKVSSKRGKEEDKLPGFEKFTDEQMFFIGFGASWCSIQRPEYLEELKEDAHSLPKLRVIGAVSNAKEFARVFHCPKGSSMNPEDKCNIWKEAEDNNEIAFRRRLGGRKRHHRSRWAFDRW